MKGKWGFLRIVNILLGLFFLSQFVMYLDWIALIFAGVLLTQAYFNVGCLMGACMTPGAFSENKTSLPEEITYEEITPN